MNKIKGVVPPMITPFDETGNLDVEGLEKLVDYLSDQVDGLFVTGSYGCGALMNLDERKKVVEVSVKKAAGRIPVIAMVGSTNNRDSIDLAKHAEVAGVQSVAAVGPYYFKHNKESLLKFYRELIDAVEIPVYLYDNPGFQGYEIDVDLVEELKDCGLAGVKDATFDILKHASYQRLLAEENFDVVLGTEAMWLSARALGCEAFIPGLANAFPEICKKMYVEGIQDDFKACKTTQFKVNKMRDIMYLAKSTQLAIYAMLEIREIVKCYPRAPFIAATEAEKKAIRKALVELGMM
ncbi:MAG: dihydrodipicolinate synthase family protein [Eubacteriaceae bacterium]|jgi:dihydrodipicolinate synthase/N-acetylneuraminate lyase